MTRILRRCVPVALTILIASTTQQASAQVGKNLGALDPNLATEVQLTALPGVSATIAQAIIAGRPYLSMSAFDVALGKSMNATARKALYPKLFLPINLNGTTDAEINLVPGMGARMLREFKEYRPFASLAVFHKEMGKYVDSTEVARLAQYVFVPVDLNTVSDDDILSIPGAGRRMVREFKEYRPWKNEAQFQKEIGKYVDAKEVSRLWSYVYIAPAK